MPDAFRLIWAPVAVADVEELLEYIATHDSIDAAVDIHHRLTERIDTLSARPQRCRIVPELKHVGVHEYRELIIAPYSVFFRIREKEVHLFAVLDRRRDVGEMLIRRATRM